MKAAIEAARRKATRTSELAAAAQHARERHDLYKAKVYGPTLTSFAKLRELEQARDLAETRLRRAQAVTGPAPPGPAAGLPDPDEPTDAD